jgi:hypothetical protein
MQARRSNIYLDNVNQRWRIAPKRNKISTILLSLDNVECKERLFLWAVNLLCLARERACAVLSGSEQVAL